MNRPLRYPTEHLHRPTPLALTSVALSLLPLPALALTPHAVIGTGDIVFYTFALSAAAFSAAIVAAYRQPQWLGYVLLTVLLVINAASQDGMLAHLIGATDFVVWALPFIITTAVSAYGYWLVSVRLEPPHPLVRFRRSAQGLAILSALLCVSSALWLKRIPLTPMWVPANLLFFTMVLAQTLPPLTWHTPDPRLRWIIRAFPVVLGIATLGVYLGHWLVFDFGRGSLNLINRMLMVMVAGFALTIVVWQAFAASREKDAAERRALQAAKAEAEMQLALARAEREYERVRSLAARHQAQLVSVSHDLKQPIASLRIAIEQLRHDNPGPETVWLDRAVDYIDSLARAFLDQADGPEENTVADSGHVDGARETVDSGLLASMIEQMFNADADERGIDFKVRAIASRIHVDPLPTMRAMTNLIGNAFAHARAGRVRVLLRLADDRVRYQVIDDGCGMDTATLQAVLSDGVRGETDAEGHGLGLGIVQALCEAQQMDFAIHSVPGRGTCASIGLPRVT
jgi:signal transduction histidine kinase